MGSACRIANVLVALSCLWAGGGCGDSPDPKLQAEIDGFVRNLQVSDKKYVGKVPFQRLPPAVGQWVEYLAHDGAGDPFLVRQELVGEEGGAFWLQQTQTTYLERSWIKLLVSNIEARDPSQIEVRRVFHKDTEGQILEVGEAVGIWNNDLRRHVALELSGDRTTTVTVPAVTFENSVMQQVAAGDQRINEWLNSEVPVWGTVKTMWGGENERWELTAFGLTGAKDVFVEK